MKDSVCVWGIMGAADIVRKNWRAIRESGNGRIKAIASRSGQRASEFIAGCEKNIQFDQPVEAVEGYETLLTDEAVQAIYLPIPTGIRDRWAMAAIEAGKHVLIEKPCSLSTDNLRQIIEAADRKNLQVMDGVMFAHSKRFRGLKQAVCDQKAIGEVRRISSSFTFCTDHEWAGSNIRANAELEPFGALGDLGWYCIRLSLEVMDNRLPHTVIGRALTSHTTDASDLSVPFEFEGTLLFDNHVSVNFYCSFVTEIQQRFCIAGTEGYVALDDFTLPFHGRKPQFEIVKHKFVTETNDFEMRSGNEIVEFDETPNSAADSQEANLFREFNKLVLTGQTDSSWPTASLQTQIVMDALMKSAQQNQTPIHLS